MPESTLSPHLWHPLGFFDDFRDAGILVFALAAVMLIAVSALFALIFRGRSSHFFSLPFFLSLVPFVICALISSLRFYLVLGGLPPHAEIESAADVIASIQYPIQFGIICSGVLILVYSGVYGFQRSPSDV